MAEYPRLTPRLEAVARMVREGAVVADIGTDHALLVAYLLAGGRCARAYASDLRPGPLARARETLRAYGLEDRVRLLLGDGLEKVPYADDVVIAGMGGGLIAQILDGCAFIRDPRVSLILQPMTMQSELRAYLCRSGFRIDEESAAREGRKFYVVMRASYCGENTDPDAFFCYAGKLPEAGTKAAAGYLYREAEKLLIRARGLASSRACTPQAPPFFELAEKLKAAADMISGDKAEKGERGYDQGK